MGLLYCHFPDCGKPLDLARALKQKTSPIEVDIDESDGFADSIAKMQSALDCAGAQRNEFEPLHSMKRNAAENAPQHQLVLHIDETTRWRVRSTVAP